MDINNIPQDKLNGLLETAGKKLGKDPAQLKAELESGKLDEVIGRLDPKTAGQVNSLLQNPDALKAMLSNDKVKNLLQGLMGGKK